MTWLKQCLAEVAEDYFEELERQGYFPAGCSGEDFADHLIEALGLTEEQATFAEHENPGIIAYRTYRWTVSQKEDIIHVIEAGGPPEKILSDIEELID